MDFNSTVCTGEIEGGSGGSDNGEINATLT